MVSVQLCTALSGAMNEEGCTTGIAVTFDTYDNGTGDTQEGPEIRVKNNGNVIASPKNDRPIY